jgi:hypothetical protein
MPTKFDLDTYAFKQTEMDRLGDEHGMLNGGVVDWKMHHSEYHVSTTEDGSRVLIHTADGERADSARHGAYLHKVRTHYFAAKVEASLLEKCFGANPSLTARGELRKEISAADFAKHAADWGSDPVRLKPGSAPDGDGTTVATKAPSAANAWSDHPSNVDPKTGRYTAAALTRQASVVRGLGAEKAAGMARSAGAFLGATSPRARQLAPR